ncbi:4'-phosphopantetheinyl transferase family protein [Rubrivivax gelatinosus]|uniref:4'-phosphopantetheinyl transferase family protein n=1 Tax=Rubrivivax gelatinosus TaxID=28068 RepID=UPI00068328BA|nr:4'-phosphopantetheinyl transferase superfamily protein [Rubrivivax gelatinosus]MBG6082457.1 4'-phosphopantetheinyl transferase EntD [Rubrivivax gelatinosus]
MQLPGFIGLRWQALSASLPGDPSACIVDFDATTFEPIAFELALLSCPPDVAASVPKRQAEYFFGRLAARLALAPLGHAGFEVRSGPMREPIWPEGVIGSISHSSGRAAAVARSRRGRSGVGLDLEVPPDAAAIEALLATVVDDAERARIALVPMHESTVLTIVYSAKESLFKAVSASAGRYFGFEAARLSNFDVGRQRVSLEIREDLGPRLQPGITCAVDFLLLDDGTVLTSCVW